MRFAPGGEVFLHFVGQGSALLRLYAVNFAFMALTLGGYVFWAKTHIRRYLWSRTLAFGDPLEYTGTGWQLCRSFLIVISLFFGLHLLLTLLSLSSLEGSLLASMAFMLVLPLFWPYAVYSSLRFRLARTNWRGIHGWLSGSPVEYAAHAWVRVLLIVVTLGLYTPYAVAFLTRFIVDNASFGSVKFRFEAKVETLSRPYYRCWLVGLIMVGCLLVGGLLWLLDGVSLPSLGGGGYRHEQSLEPAGFKFLKVGALGLLLCRLSYCAVRLNWRIRGLRFGDARLDSRVTVPGYLWLTLSNWLLLAVTLGVAWPWTVVRRSRYLADRIKILGEVRWSDVRQSDAGPPKSGEGGLSFLKLDVGF